MWISMTMPPYIPTFKKKIILCFFLNFFCAALGPFDVNIHDKLPPYIPTPRLPPLQPCWECVKTQFDFFSKLGSHFKTSFHFLTYNQFPYKERHQNHFSHARRSVSVRWLARKENFWAHCPLSKGEFSQINFDVPRFS